MEDFMMKQRSKFQLKGERLVKEAEKKLQVESFGVPPSYLSAADSFEEAAKNFDKAKSWDQLGATYVKLSECYLKIRDGPHSPHYPIFAANYYIKAADAYGKLKNFEEVVSCVNEAVQILMRYDFFQIKGAYSEDVADFFLNEGAYFHTNEILRIAKAYSEIAKEYKQKYTQEENLVQAILCYEITVRVLIESLGGLRDKWGYIDFPAREKISKEVEQVIKVIEQKRGDKTYYYSFKDKTFKRKKEEDKIKFIFGLTSKKEKIEIGLWVLVFTFLIWFNYWLWYGISI